MVVINLCYEKLDVPVTKVKEAWKVFAVVNNELHSIKYNTTISYIRGTEYKSTHEDGIFAYLSREEAIKLKDFLNGKDMSKDILSCYHKGKKISRFVVKKIYPKDIKSLGYAGTNKAEIIDKTNNRLNALCFNKFSLS
jgi:hypothetical protein